MYESLFKILFTSAFLLVSVAFVIFLDSIGSHPKILLFRLITKFRNSSFKSLKLSVKPNCVFNCSTQSIFKSLSLPQTNICPYLRSANLRHSFGKQNSSINEALIGRHPESRPFFANPSFLLVQIRVESCSFMTYNGLTLFLFL